MAESLYTVFGFNFPISSVIAVFALLVSVWSVIEARRARLAALPKPIVNVDYEAYDSRDLKKGELLYYTNWAITNTGGSTVTLRGFAEKLQFPMVAMSKDNKFIKDVPKVTVYHLIPGQFDKIEGGEINLDSLKPISLEEFGSLNIAIPSGETKTVPILFKIDSGSIDGNGCFLNLKLQFSNGYSQDVCKMIRYSFR